MARFPGLSIALEKFLVLTDFVVCPNWRYGIKFGKSGRTGWHGSIKGGQQKYLFASALALQPTKRWYPMLLLFAATWSYG